MTQAEFFKKNIEFVKKNKTVKYKLCEGVEILFKKISEKDKYDLYLNGKGVERNQNYSDYAIKNSFLNIKNNAYFFQWTPFADGTYAIKHDIELKTNIHNMLTIKWDDVKRIS